MVDDPDLTMAEHADAMPALGVDGEHQRAVLGNYDAQFRLAERYRTGHGVVRDPIQAFKWYRMAADAGHSLAENGLGTCLTKGIGCERDEVLGVEYFRKAATQGVPLAMNNLGVAYRKGQGVQQSYEQAVMWFSRAAYMGLPIAQNNLGNCFQHGEGTRADAATAAAWYRKAAEQGYALAQRNLGSCYRDGFGVGQNLAESASWYRKAADQGNEYAQYHLGMLYLSGSGLPRDAAEGVNWLRKASVQGLARAQFQLGVCYLRGEGVRIDIDEASRWMQRAAAAGSEEARQHLNAGRKPSTAKNTRRQIKPSGNAVTAPLAIESEPTPRLGSDVIGSVEPSAVVWSTAPETITFAPAFGQFNAGDEVVDGSGGWTPVGTPILLPSPVPTEITQEIFQSSPIGDSDAEPVSNLPQAEKAQTLLANEVSGASSALVTAPPLSTNTSLPITQSPSVAPPTFVSTRAPTESDYESGKLTTTPSGSDDASVPKPTARVTRVSPPSVKPTLASRQSAVSPSSQPMTGAAGGVPTSAPPGIVPSATEQIALRPGVALPSPVIVTPAPQPTPVRINTPLPQTNRISTPLPKPPSYANERSSDNAIEPFADALTGPPTPATPATAAFRASDRHEAKSAPSPAAVTMYQQGLAYLKGDGVALNKAQAITNFTNASKLDYPPAMTALGQCYERGDGVAQDKQLALSWYRRAADRGEAIAQCQLAVHLTYGWGVKRDLAAAMQWYLLAAAQGYAQAQYQLGECYAKGWGVKPDLTQATTWWQKAADQGHQDAQDSLKRVRR